MAANEAVFMHGNPTFMDYTPGSDIPAGEIFDAFGADLAGGIAIPHLPLTSGVKGAVAIGGGIYKSLADAAIALGVLVFWDDTANRITATATANRQAGYCVQASTGAGGEIWFQHLKA